MIDGRNVPCIVARAESGSNHQGCIENVDEKRAEQLQWLEECLEEA